MPRKKKRAAAETTIGQIAKAVGHPLRVRILGALVSQDGSASTLSRQFDVPLGDVDYHLGVLDRDCQVIELVGHRQVRGAQENIYRLKPWTNFDPDWSPIPRPVVSGLKGALLWRFVDAAIAALRFGTFDRRQETTFTARPVVVDERGWAEANHALTRTVETVTDIETQSRRRLSGSGPEAAIHIVVGLAAFEAAWPSQGWEQG